MPVKTELFDEPNRSCTFAVSLEALGESVKMREGWGMKRNA